jgi:5-(carboxyamino)imidazole ribonucleotide synthase
LTLGARREAILPGAVLGVLGSGQLGRMFAIAARRMGYHVHVLSPDDDTPTGQVADVEIRADYDDEAQIAEFAQGVSVVTFEFENVPAIATETAARFVPVRPSGSVLFTSQNRLREKARLQAAGLPVTPFRPVRSAAELARGVESLGAPAVLKTAAWGYDGKGQVVLRSAGDAVAAWQSLGAAEAILEAWIDFEKEVSVVAARGVDGEFVAYPVFENAHRNHILDVTVCPARVPDAVQLEARDIARSVLTALDVVGVLCVEFFVTKDGRLLINETAPRPHNSGHLTIDAHHTCQFEQQVRAVCGLPLGDIAQWRPAAMANLLGDLWADGEPNWSAALADPHVKLHLYGKREPRPGRKMGHLTALAETVDEAERLVRAARSRLHATAP